ncbi:uncharacterized protein LOC110979185 [Acanthaster planci]|uniref:Uncharacterized protein LOC110979185 n=1 Tax=Acanthaster planci TaxID=133434 RepID=A0A8B7YDL9_ACAPL|nr:uncharacterized protein LOC110979185 [Acanthaster planci]XP_022090471.1 uncharacterized protein LOC110979185 [Acanthaster planci]
MTSGTEGPLLELSQDGTVRTGLFPSELWIQKQNETQDSPELQADPEVCQVYVQTGRQSSPEWSTGFLSHDGSIKNLNDIRSLDSVSAGGMSGKPHPVMLIRANPISDTDDETETSPLVPSSDVLQALHAGDEDALQTSGSPELPADSPELINCKPGLLSYSKNPHLETSTETERKPLESVFQPSPPLVLQETVNTPTSEFSSLSSQSYSETDSANSKICPNQYVAHQLYLMTCDPEPTQVTHTTCTVSCASPACRLNVPSPVTLSRLVNNIVRDVSGTLRDRTKSTSAERASVAEITPSTYQDDAILSESSLTAFADFSSRPTFPSKRATNNLNNNLSPTGESPITKRFCSNAKEVIDRILPEPQPVSLHQVDVRPRNETHQMGSPHCQEAKVHLCHPVSLAGMLRLSSSENKNTPTYSSGIHAHAVIGKDRHEPSIPYLSSNVAFGHVPASRFDAAAARSVDVAISEDQHTDSLITPMPGSHIASLPSPVDFQPCVSQASNILHVPMGAYTFQSPPLHTPAVHMPDAFLLGETKQLSHHSANSPARAVPDVHSRKDATLDAPWNSPPIVALASVAVPTIPSSSLLRSMLSNVDSQGVHFNSLLAHSSASKSPKHTPTVSSSQNRQASTPVSVSGLVSPSPRLIPLNSPVVPKNMLPSALSPSVTLDKPFRLPPPPYPGKKPGLSVEESYMYPHSMHSSRYHQTMLSNDVISPVHESDQKLLRTATRPLINSIHSPRINTCHCAYCVSACRYVCTAATANIPPKRASKRSRRRNPSQKKSLPMQMRAAPQDASPQQSAPSDRTSKLAQTLPASPSDASLQSATLSSQSEKYLATYPSDEEVLHPHPPFTSKGVDRLPNPIVQTVVTLSKAEVVSLPPDTTAKPEKNRPGSQTTLITPQPCLKQMSSPDQLQHPQASLVAQEEVIPAQTQPCEKQVLSQPCEKQVLLIDHGPKTSTVRQRDINPSLTRPCKEQMTSLDGVPEVSKIPQGDMHIKPKQKMLCLELCPSSNQVPDTSTSSTIPVQMQLLEEQSSSSSDQGPDTSRAAQVHANPSEIQLCQEWSSSGRAAEETTAVSVEPGNLVKCINCSQIFEQVSSSSLTWRDVKILVGPKFFDKPWALSGVTMCQSCLTSLRSVGCCQQRLEKIKALFKQAAFPESYLWTGSLCKSGKDFCMHCGGTLLPHPYRVAVFRQTAEGWFPADVITAEFHPLCPLQEGQDLYLCTRCYHDLGAIHNALKQVEVSWAKFMEKMVPSSYLYYSNQLQLQRQDYGRIGGKS